MFLVNTYSVFMFSLLNTEIFGNKLLRLSGILITPIEFLNKLHNLIVLMNWPEIKSRIRIILKYATHIEEVAGLKGSINLKALRRNKYFIK